MWRMPQGKPVFAHPQNMAGVEAVIAAGVDVMAHTVAGEPVYSPEQLARFKQQGIALDSDAVAVCEAPGRRPISLRAWLLRPSTRSRRSPTMAVRSCSAPMSASPPIYDTTLEYELMHRALSERQILASLTTNPAQYFKAAKKGRVEKGFDADLVVLDGDPLADVTTSPRSPTPSAPAR